VAWNPFREKQDHALVKMCCRRRARVWSRSLGTNPSLNENVLVFYILSIAQYDIIKKRILLFGFAPGYLPQGEKTEAAKPNNPGEAPMAIQRPNISRLRTGLVVGALLGYTVAAAIPAQAQGTDDFLNDTNGIGIGSHDDPHNFDLVGLGNAICWRLYTGQAPSHIADDLAITSRSNGSAALTADQATAEVGFALADLCPDAAPK
jgi:hypothetical protein